ncbi:transthyretin-like family protein [Leptothoe spongobia]|uniref:Uncharacterized protein n=1 Tax=Leptothoe spongobia TAU-MAC 1115 TaxID=1967444 RepID=A0A947GHK0_9CYAN|nr:hypothetical protein [Leptothoe spongobia]MBT9314127.1 hypothetical protein [Leptothoe spongobia TAU-MAC 1115]
MSFTSSPPLSFSFKEVLESFLPPLISVCLFVPYVFPSFQFSAALVLAALAGLIISPAITKIAFNSSKKIIFPLTYPVTKRNWETLHKERFWCEDNWDFDRLDYYLKPDMQNLIYLSGAYIKFYTSLSFYFFIYSFLQVIFLLSYIFISIKDILQTPTGSGVGEIFLNLFQQQTPLLGGTELPTLLTLLISAVAMYMLVDQAQLEYLLLFGKNGHYDKYARAYHEINGHLAKSIWGRVQVDGMPLRLSKMKLQEIDSVSPDDAIGEGKTDENGYFQLRNPLRINEDSKQYRIIFTYKQKDKDIKLLHVLDVKAHEVPEFNLNLKETS